MAVGEIKLDQLDDEALMVADEASEQFKRAII